MWLLRGCPFRRDRAGRWALRCGLARRLPQVREEREVTREHAEGEEQVEGAVSKPYLRVEEEELGGEEDGQQEAADEKRPLVDLGGDQDGHGGAVAAAGGHHARQDELR